MQKQLNSQIIANLISIGDSDFEMVAVQVTGKEFEQAFMTIKFQQKRSPEELLTQLQLEISLTTTNETAKNQVENEVKHASITLPAYFNGAQRQSTKDAGWLERSTDHQ